MIRKNDNRSGFTLVEMIAVILIVAILIGVVSAGLNTARENVWRTRARDTARQLVDAWNLYLLDNRAFPEESELKVGGVKGAAFGIPATIKALKPLRPETGAQYLELSFDEAYKHKKGTSKAELSGIGGKGMKKDDNEVALFDRWRQPICFNLDFDYDGYVDVPSYITKKRGAKGGKPRVKANAAAWSMGPPARKGKKWVAAWK